MTDTTPAAFSRRDAIKAGHTDLALHREFHRLSYGWYAERPPRDLRELCRAYAAILLPDMVWSDATAAALWGLPTPPTHRPVEVHLHAMAPPGSPVLRRRELTVHRRYLRRHDSVLLDEGLHVLTPSRLFLDVAASWDEGYVVALGDAMLRRGLTDRATLAATLAHSTRQRGVATARHLARQLRPEAQSAPESVLRYRLTKAGLRFTPQCAITEPSGQLLGHADLGDPHARIAIEYEGRHHLRGSQLEYDVRRYQRFHQANWTVIRADRADLTDQGQRLIDRITTLLRQSETPRESEKQ